MEINNKHRVRPAGQEQRAEEQRIELIQTVRARTEAATREIQEFRRANTDRSESRRDEILLGRTDSRATDERTRAENERRETADRLEVAARTRQLAAAAARKDAAYEERVEELRKEFAAGRLHSPERLERAARRLLGDEHVEQD
ncbi:MAG: hypothetical protein EPO68_05720 [Planctomycetota bacterium]|nr:MAG: hypothetical protein EPO68_05720 [Planctomycetota bacterium]